MFFFRFSKPNECELIRSQVNTYSPVLAKFIDYLFVKNNIEDHDKIQKWIILIIDRIKNKDNRPLADYDKIIINKNIVLDDYLKKNKELISFKQQSDIIRLFKVVDVKFKVHWIIWDFAESLSDPILFINIFPTLYKSYIKISDYKRKSQTNQNQKCIQPSIFGSGLNLFLKKSQFELVIDRYLPLLQITNDFFKEKLIFLSFLFDEMINITLTEFSELINAHIPLILTDTTDPQKNGQFSQKKIIRMIKRSISIFDHDFEIVSNFFKIPICYNITEIDRQLVIFHLFTKRYHKLQNSLKININNIKNNENNPQYINFIQRTITCINNYKEAILISMIKSFNKNTCPDFRFSMLNFIIKNSSFESEIFSFSEISSNNSIEMHSSNECNTKTEVEITKSIEINTTNENKSKIDCLSSKSNDHIIQEVSQILHHGQIKDHFSFTKLCFALSDQEIYDHNDILVLVQISRMCRREFSALSIHKLLRVASSNAILNRTVLWGFSHSSSNLECFPDRMFGSPGVVTIIVFFIMRAFEFLTISSIPNKYRTKQRITADTILMLYKRACLSLAEICQKEKNDDQPTLNSEQNKNNNRDNESVNNERKEKIETNEIEISNKNERIEDKNQERNESHETVSNESIEDKNQERNESAKTVSNESIENKNQERNESHKVENNGSIESKKQEINENADNDSIENDAQSENVFHENEEGVKIKNWKLVNLFTKRGFQMIKDSIEVGVSTMNLFKSTNISLFNDEIKPADLLILIDQIKSDTQKKQEIKKRSSEAKQIRNLNSRKRRETGSIEMINIGFAILSKDRFSLAMPIFFKKLFGELTRIPLQKFDLKNMCANFEPEFPLRKEAANKKSKNIFLQVQDQLFKSKLNEVIDENDESIEKTKIEIIKKEAEIEPKVIQNSDENNNNDSNENKKNLRNLSKNSMNLMEKMMPKKKPEIINKKETEND